jgi:hypothetical protein
METLGIALATLIIVLWLVILVAWLISLGTTLQSGEVWPESPLFALPDDPPRAPVETHSAA